MTKILAGKKAIVTGSSSGIGRSIALSLAEHGAEVVVNARGKSAVDDVVKLIRDQGGKAVGAAGPVNDASFAEELVDSCRREFGGIDILINNAGVFTPLNAADCPIDHWREVLDVNLNAQFYLSHFALPHLVAQRWGRIINASSLAGLGVLGGSAYAASKSALIGFSKAMAADYGRYGITVNAYNPEAVTPMGVSDDRGALAAMYQNWHEKGYLSAADVAFAVEVGGPDGVAPWITYLCTEAAANLNGQVFAVDGRRVGMLAQFEEKYVLTRDFAAQGPWKIEELLRLAPWVFPVANRYPQRSEEQLAAENAGG